MQERTLELHPETNNLVWKRIEVNYEDADLEQVKAKVEENERAVVQAQAFALATGRGLVEGSQDVAQLANAYEAEDKAKAALEDSKSDLSRATELVANAPVSGAEEPSEDATSGEMENSY